MKLKVLFRLVTLALLAFLDSLTFAQNIAIQDFDGNNSWTYTTSPSPNSASCVSGGDVWNVVSSLGSITVPNSTGNFWGVQDLQGASGCGTSGVGTLDFSTFNISGCTGVSISFDYEIDGFNAPGDALSYIVTIDGAPEPEVFICDGCDQQDFEGTETINIPNGSTDVSLQIRFEVDGGSDYAGIDNITLNGSCSTNTITTGAISPLSYTVDCSTGQSGTVDYSSVGTFNVGNTFIAQLSDASGSFASPINIGNEPDDGVDPSGQINITIPAGTASGTGYRIRIISDDPSTIGSDNGTDISITLSGGPCITTSYDCNSVIWYEDFESYTDGVYSETQTGALVAANNNTVNPDPDWTCHGNNCDSDGNLGDVNENYFGVSTNASGNKEFRVNDIEGLTCCTSTEGASDNYWITEEIDISSYATISIAISARVEGDVECTSCGSGRDEFNAQYSTDGGTTWSAPFYTICGATSGFTEVNCIDVTGSSLIIRVLLGNQANDENYFFDDIIVCESSCSVLLPVDIHSFYGEYDDYKSANVIHWTSESEQNNEKYILLHSVNGMSFQSIGEITGAGNSSSLINYSFDHREAAPGINYYKLQSVDYDGTVHEKGTIAVMVDQDQVYYDQVSTQILFPNQDNYIVYDASGKVVGQSMNKSSILFDKKGVFFVLNSKTGESSKLIIQ